MLHSAIPLPDDIKLVAHWDELVAQWANDPALPLFVRKSVAGIARGEAISHSSGRTLVLTDNSPANWSFLAAHEGWRYDITEIRELLAADSIPVAMVIDRQMKERSRYRCCRVQGLSPNALGWKVCHREPVGLGGRLPVAERSINDLKNHFRRFLSPSNMFLIPIVIGGLGECQEIIEAAGASID